MIPFNTKVIAIDDRPDELREIVQGLGRAGFSVSPFYFCDGALEDEPPHPLEGVRIVFTDIHMSIGGHDPKKNANTIVSCLKKILVPGPFVIIFWTQFPGDADEIAREVSERLVEREMQKPLGCGAIDKKEVFGVAGNNANFDSEKLRDLIKAEVEKFEPLMLSISWEDRVYRAAARTTNGLFNLIQDPNNEGLQDWSHLMAFLASEAVGFEAAEKDSAVAFDQAMLPLLEDQLSFIDSGRKNSVVNYLRKVLLEKSKDGRIDCPERINITRIQSGYLLDAGISENVKSWSRGVVSRMDDVFINSEIFINSFGNDVDALIKREFVSGGVILTPEEMSRLKLHAVELGPECDHVQAKLASQRYLLSVLVPDELSWAFRNQKRPPGKKSRASTKNVSVIDIGSFSLRNSENNSHEDWSLFISCKCFMAFEKKKEFSWTPVFRLRRALIDEVAHLYVTHARRPGVMRFAA